MSLLLALTSESCVLDATEDQDTCSVVLTVGSASAGDEHTDLYSGVLEWKRKKQRKAERDRLAALEKQKADEKRKEQERREAERRIVVKASFAATENADAFVAVAKLGPVPLFATFFAVEAQDTFAASGFTWFDDSDDLKAIMDFYDDDSFDEMELAA